MLVYQSFYSSRKGSTKNLLVKGSAHGNMIQNVGKNMYQFSTGLIFKEESGFSNLTHVIVTVYFAYVKSLIVHRNSEAMLPV